MTTDSKTTSCNDYSEFLRTMTARLRLRFHWLLLLMNKQICHQRSKKSSSPFSPTLSLPLPPINLCTKRQVIKPQLLPNLHVLTALLIRPQQNRKSTPRHKVNLISFLHSSSNTKVSFLCQESVGCERGEEVGRRSAALLGIHR